MSEIFSVDQRPSRGSLKFRVGEKIEAIDFGAAQGIYAAGIFFNGSSLPAPWSEQFKGQYVLQILLGTVTTKLSTQTPQFGTALLVTSKIPKKKVIFKAGLPGGKASNLAVFLITSPATPKEQPQEERLKNTYFSEKGSAELLPLARPDKVEVKSASGRYVFRHQAMRLTVVSDLVTPFNPVEANLRGEVTLPVYWPAGKDSELLMKKLAARALSQLTTTQTKLPEGISSHTREIAGSNPVPPAKEDSPPALPETPEEEASSDPHTK